MSRRQRSRPGKQCLSGLSAFVAEIRETRTRALARGSADPGLARLGGAADARLGSFKAAYAAGALRRLRPDGGAELLGLGLGAAELRAALRDDDVAGPGRSRQLGGGAEGRTEFGETRCAAGAPAGSGVQATWPARGALPGHPLPMAGCSGVGGAAAGAPQKGAEDSLDAAASRRLGLSRRSGVRRAEGETHQEPQARGVARLGGCNYLQRGSGQPAWRKLAGWLTSRS